LRYFSFDTLTESPQSGKSTKYVTHGHGCITNYCFSFSLWVFISFI